MRRRPRPAPSPPVREVAPACLRYQFLEAGPGSTPLVVGGVSGGVGLVAAFGAAFLTGVSELAYVAPFVAAIAGVVGARFFGPFEGVKNLRALPVAIVPWGLILDPDGAPAPVPWARIHHIKYTLVTRDRRNDRQLPKLAIVVFDLGKAGNVQAQAEEGDWVVAVTELHDELAAAASTPPAADLDGATQLDPGGLPVALALLRRAEAILDSADGRASLGLEAGGYRSTTSRAPGEPARDVLRAALRGGEGAFDPGPLAAILAAQLRVASLLPDLLTLIMSPSPLLAAVARAASVRLGASLMTAGSLDETKLFVPAADRTELQLWMTR